MSWVTAVMNPDHDAGEGADDSGEGDQPDLVGAHQGAQQVRGVHHHVAERAAMRAGGRGSGDGRGTGHAGDPWVALNARHA